MGAVKRPRKLSTEERALKNEIAFGGGANSESPHPRYSSAIEILGERSAESPPFADRGDGE